MQTVLLLKLVCKKAPFRLPFPYFSILTEILDFGGTSEGCYPQTEYNSTRNRFINHKHIIAYFSAIGIGRRYEEWFITDYDCPDAVIGKVLGEYESLSELNYLAGQIMELRESDDFWQAVLDLGENTGSVHELINLTENKDCFDYLPSVRNDYDLGYYWIEESGCYDTSNLGALSNYIDYEGFGRDIRYEEGGVFGDNGYVRSNGGRFVDIYDGDIENIPEEYRISSPAVPVRSAATRQAEQPER